MELRRGWTSDSPYITALAVHRVAIHLRRSKSWVMAENRGTLGRFFQTFLANARKLRELARGAHEQPSTCKEITSVPKASAQSDGAASDNVCPTKATAVIRRRAEPDTTLRDALSCQSARKRDPLSASKRDPGVSACAGSP
jgi:hypothetical protein